MRTITTETQVFYFEELPEESQKMATENYHDINVDYGWYSFEIEYWQGMLANIGFDNAEIRFSGFWSQGDGASFTADVDFLNLLPEYIEYACNGLDKKARRLIALAEAGYFDNCFRIDFTDSRYCHENTMAVSSDYWSMDCLIDGEIDELEEDILALARFIAQDIYKSLETTYDYLTSEEGIQETLITNDYEFTLDGEIF